MRRSTKRLAAAILIAALGILSACRGLLRCFAPISYAEIRL